MTDQQWGRCRGHVVGIIATHTAFEDLVVCIGVDKDLVLSIGDDWQGDVSCLLIAIADSQIKITGNRCQQRGADNLTVARKVDAINPRSARRCVGIAISDIGYRPVDLNGFIRAPIGWRGDGGDLQIRFRTARDSDGR